MRLIEIKKEINAATECFDYKFEDSKNGIFPIKNIANIKKAIEILLRLGFLDSSKINSNFNNKKEIDIIISSQTDILYFGSSDFQHFKVFLPRVKFLLEQLSLWINDLMPDEQTEDTVNIKFPEIRSFDELSKLSSGLKRALSIVVDEYEGGKTEIVSFDHGSFWASIRVGTAMVLVTSLVWSGAVIAKKIMEAKQMQENIRTMELKNESIEDFNKAINKHRNILLNEEAALIQKEHFTGTDNERLKRIETALDNISQLVLKGIEILCYSPKIGQ